MDEREVTIKTYQDSASELAAYFRGIGARSEDVQRAFKLCHYRSPEVVEIGCGDGRDAAEIIARTDRYRGFDTSEKMVKLARAALPDQNFEVADLATYEFPRPTHLVFAFAALLHSPPLEIQSVLERSAAVMPSQSVWYISLKEGTGSVIQEDQFGRRTFYLYEMADIVGYAWHLFHPVFGEYQTIGSTRWFTLALRRR